MEIIIRETGKTVDLKYINNGVDCAQDIIGNAGALGDPDQFSPAIDEDGDETTDWTCSQETFDWWHDYLRGLRDTDDEIDELADDMARGWDHDASPDGPYSMVQDRVQAAISGLDKEHERGAAEAEIKAIRQEYGLDA